MKTRKQLFYDLRRALNGCSIEKADPLAVEVYSQTRTWKNAQKTADKLVKLLVAIRDWKGKDND